MTSELERRAVGCIAGTRRSATTTATRAWPPVLGGVNHGRDADSIAVMGDAIPRDWLAGVAAASRLDLRTPGLVMAEVAREVFARDEARHQPGSRSCGSSVQNDHDHSGEWRRKPGEVDSRVRLTWVQPEDLLPHELVQSVAEGRDTSAVAARWVAAGGSLDVSADGASGAGATPRQRDLARDLLGELDAMPRASDLDAAEPDDLASIVATWPDVPSLPSPPDRYTLRERLRGAWFGRAVGCLLGKPVEKIPRRGIRAILEATDRWPLAGYFTEHGLPPDVAARWPWNRRSRPTSLAENIDGMPEDDDLNFTMLALRVLERHGREFTTDDVAQAWLDDVPAGRLFTAERVAYRNLLDGYPPDQAARVRNPFREWIGAQIRADLYGWVCPGRPGDAARLAWRDARLSHTRNGVYGAMFVAAASAAALVVDDPRTVLTQGLGVVPPTSRLAKAVRSGMALADAGVAGEEAYDALHGAYGHLHWVHVLNNAALVAYAVAASDGDFTAAITTAVAGGWDTDSDGATAGGLLGAMAGEWRLSPSWVDPLHDRVASSLPGFDGVALTSLADRTHALLEADQ